MATLLHDFSERIRLKTKKFLSTTTVILPFRTLRMYSSTPYSLCGDYQDVGAHYAAQQASVVVEPRIATLNFQCHSSVVGTLVGRKWSRVKKLSSDFESHFPGFKIDVTHDGVAFNIVMANFSAGIAFVTNTFGAEISLANQGINIRPQFVGRIIGTGGHNLRDIEAGAGTPCTIYHDSLFWVHFPCDTPVTERRNAFAYIKERMIEYTDYLEDRLGDTASETSHSDVSVAASDISDNEQEFMWPKLA